jgi:DNA topoisomerase I
VKNENRELISDESAYYWGAIQRRSKMAVAKKAAAKKAPAKKPAAKAAPAKKPAAKKAPAKKKK